MRSVDEGGLWVEIERVEKEIDHSFPTYLQNCIWRKIKSTQTKKNNPTNINV